MHITRFQQAPTYEAPNHFDMTCLRLQGHEAGPAVQLWMGVSVIEPGGHTTLAPSPMEKMYVVLEGELELTGQLPNDEPRTETLRTWDSCRFAPGEARQIRNAGSQIARILLAMPFTPPTPAAT